MRAEDAIEAKQVRNALAPPLRYHLLLTACAMHKIINTTVTVKTL